MPFHCENKLAKINFSKNLTNTLGNTFNTACFEDINWSFAKANLA